ncbi:hypothetical protein LTR95_011841 [Oleoguttula sp. CCFEE 5521]
MAIDADISNMKRDELQKRLRELKASGMKVNVSGSAAELKQRLQDARDKTASTTEPAAAASPGSVGSVSVVSTAPAVPGAGVSAMLLDHEQLHPLVLEMLKKLTTQSTAEDDDAVAEEVDQEPYGVLEDADQILLLDPYLQPVSRLVDEIIRARDCLNTSTLNSSGAINFETFARLLRNSMTRTLIPTVLAPLFDAFGLVTEVTELEEAASTDLPTSTSASDVHAASGMDVDSLQQAMQRRYAEDLREATRHSQNSQSSQPDAAGDPTTLPLAAADTSMTDAGVAPPGGEEVTTTAAPKLSTQLLNLQVATMQQGIRHMLRDWAQTFPTPENRLWPVDFDQDEVNKVKQHIRKWARDEANQVNLDLHKQPDSKADQVVTAMLADDGFPVDDAKKTDTITSVFRDVCSQIYATNLKSKRQKEEKEKQKAAEEEEEEAGGAQTSQIKQRAKRGKKRALDDDDDEIEDDDGAGLPDRTAQPWEPSLKKKLTLGSRGADADEEGQFVGGESECMACFFAGVQCSLKFRNEPGRVCDTCVPGLASGIACRELCDECKMVGEDAGRASGPEGASFLLNECPDCTERF